MSSGRTVPLISRERDTKLLELGLLLLKKKPDQPPPKKKEKSKTGQGVTRKRRPLLDREAKENVPPERSRRSTTRPKRYLYYESSDEEDVDDVQPAEEEKVNEDDYLYCRTCKEEVQDGCQKHPLTFKDGKDIVRIDKSKIKAAGLGAFNGSTSAIPVDTVFGPYTGEKSKEKKLKESGYAWSILDSETKTNVVSYVDPGHDPDRKENWLAFVNQANYEMDLNVKATQFKGQIFYRVVRSIQPGEELLTHYGDDYADELNIDKDVFKHGTRWKEF